MVNGWSVEDCLGDDEGADTDKEKVRGRGGGKDRCVCAHRHAGPDPNVGWLVCVQCESVKRLISSVVSELTSLPLVRIRALYPSMHSRLCSAPSPPDRLIHLHILHHVIAHAHSQPLPFRPLQLMRLVRLRKFILNTRDFDQVVKEYAALDSPPEVLERVIEAGMHLNHIARVHGSAKRAAQCVHEGDTVYLPSTGKPLANRVEPALLEHMGMSEGTADKYGLMRWREAKGEQGATGDGTPERPPYDGVAGQEIFFNTQSGQSAGEKTTDVMKPSVR